MSEENSQNTSDNMRCTLSGTPTSLNDEFADQSTVSEDKPDIDLSTQLQQPYIIFKKPKISLKEIEQSILARQLAKNFGNYHSFKETLKQQLKGKCTYNSQFFRQVCNYIRNTLTENDIHMLITTCSSNMLEVFNNLGPNSKMNVACLIDILSVAPTSHRLLIWLGRQLTYTCSDMSNHSKIKCAVIARIRKWYTKKGEYYWCILDKNNTFTLRQMKDPFDEKYRLNCDVISTSRSRKSIKLLSTPEKDDIIVVPKDPHYSRELWTKNALRDEEVPYYESLVYFHKPMPPFILEPSLLALQSKTMLVPRALLNPEVIQPENSRSIIDAFIDIFSQAQKAIESDKLSCEKGSINTFVNMLLGLEFNRTDAHDPYTIFENPNYLDVLFEVYLSRYCTTYFSNVIAGLMGDICKNGPAGEITDDKIKTSYVIDTLNKILDKLIANKLPRELRHLIHIVGAGFGIKYGRYKDQYIGVAEIVFNKMILQFMENPNKLETISTNLSLNHNFRPELANPVARILRHILMFKPFPRESYPSLHGIESKIPAIKEKASNYINTLIPMTETPVYDSPKKDELIDKAIVILHTISDHKDKFLIKIREENLRTDKNPVSWSAIINLHSLSCSQKA